MNSAGTSTPPTATPALDALRAATADVHVALEAQLDLGRIDREGYRALLSRFLGFYEPLERSAPCYAQPGWLDEVDRRKAEWLVADLRALALSERQIAALPRCAWLPPLNSAAEQLGCMYVIEGSTLGGAHIARHVLPRLGITSATGGAFFHSYGAGVGKNWRTLLAGLETRIDSDPARREAAAAARQTFTLLQAWLSGGLFSR
jgi:heme oxygenase